MYQTLVCKGKVDIFVDQAMKLILMQISGETPVYPTKYCCLLWEINLTVTVSNSNPEIILSQKPLLWLSFIWVTVHADICKVLQKPARQILQTCHFFFLPGTSASKTGRNNVGNSHLFKFHLRK